MRAYRFRLETVARVRSVEERAAAQQLALASRRLVEARHDEAGAVGKLDRLEGPRGRTAAGGVRWAYDQADRAGARVGAERRRVAVVDAERDAARQAWTTARQRCTVLERLDERHRARWEIERGRREAGELDEVATVRFRSGEVDR